jgi:putative transposase
MIARKETGCLAKAFIQETCDKQSITQDTGLFLHSDRGSSMKSKGVLNLMADMGVTNSFSRPYVPNDNPFSESHFKTMKYRPEFPDRFGSIEDARLFCRNFFSWYNNHHYHSGIGYLTPASLHYDKAEQIIENRKKVLQEAYMKKKVRFANGVPQPRPLPEAVWINPPQKEIDKLINTH